MGIAVNSSGVVFVASRGGIHIGHKSGTDSAYQFKLHAFPAGLKPKTVFQIGTDGEGRAWFGCGDGLCILRADGNYEFHREDLGLSSDKWNGFGFDTSGNAWLRSNQSLMRMRSGAQRFEPISTPPKSAHLALLFPQPNGETFFPSSDGLWLGEASGVVSLIAEKRNGLSSEVVSEVLKDHEGNLWLGFLEDGLARWQGYRKWEGWTQEEGLNSNAVWTLLRDGQKTLWAGTDGGVNFMPQGARPWESLLGKSNQSIGRVMSFARENPQIIWAASQTKGLIRIDTRDRSLQIVGFPANASVKYLHGILIDSKRRLWLGTSMGLFEASVDQPLRWNPVE